jgi:addiction module HigA family antidote
MIVMHPGEYIFEVYVEPLGIGVTDLAVKLAVSASTVSRIINQKADVTPSMALKLSYVLGRSAESWMSMQTSYSLHRESETFSSEGLKRITV